MSTTGTVGTGTSTARPSCRVLLVSNMYPSARDRRFGVFVERFEAGLRAAGLSVERVVNTDPRTGVARLAAKYARLLVGAVGASVRGGYDVVHAHYLFPTGPFALIASRLRRAPLVLFSHGTDLLMGHRRWPIGALTRFAVGQAAVVIAPSSAHAASLRDTFGLAEDRVRVLPSGIDTQTFHPAPGGEVGREHDVLFVGALDDNKGLGCEDLVRAIAKPELEGVRLTVVGDGPRRESLTTLVCALGLEERVTFLPPQPSDRIADLLRSSRLVAVVPRERESLGLIALEAKASHVPVVATRVGGLPEHVAPGVSGELVEPGDVGRLAQALLLALDRSSKRLYDYDADGIRDIASAGAELAALTIELKERGAA